MPDNIDSLRQSEALARVYVTHALIVAYSHLKGRRFIAKNETKAKSYFDYLVLKIETLETTPIVEDPEEEGLPQSNYRTVIEELELLNSTEKRIEFYAKRYRALEEYFLTRRAQDKEYFEHCVAQLNTDHARRCFDRFLTLSGLAEHLVTLAALVIDSVLDVSTWYSNLDAAHQLHILNTLKAIRMVSAIFCLIIAIAILMDVALCLRDTTLSLYQEKQPLTMPLILNTFFNMLIAENRHYRLIKHTVLLTTSALGLIFPHLAAPFAVVFYATVLTIFLIKSHKEIQELSQKEEFVKQKLHSINKEINIFRHRFNENAKDIRSLIALEQARHVRKCLEEQQDHLAHQKQKGKDTQDAMISLILFMALGGALAVYLPLIGTGLLLTVTLAIIAYQARQKQTEKAVEFTPIKAPRGQGFFDAQQPSTSDISFQPQLRLSLAQ